MTTQQDPAYYGMRELKGLYQKYASRGMIVAVALHFLIIGGYYITQILGDDE